MGAEIVRHPMRLTECSPRRITPELSLSYHQAYRKATQLLTEHTSHHNEVVSYLPYNYLVEGKEGQHTIASRYTSVEIDGKKAWFEVMQDTPEVPVTKVSFVASHPLDLILLNTQNPDTAKIAEQIDHPQPGNSLIRVVGFDEVPLIDGYERVTDPQQLLEASQKVVEHILPENPADVGVELPTTEALEIFASEQLSFSPIYQASNRTTIGKGRHIEAGVGTDEVRDIYIYPTRTEDEAGKKHQTYLISTEEINPDKLVEHGTIIGREDSICGCEKLGRGALNHSCGHEILGSLQKQSRAYVPVVIAWDPSADCNANGSVMHSLKSKNVERTHLSPELQAFGKEYEREVALIDRRNFGPLAQSLAGAAEFFNSSYFMLQSTNSHKFSAMDQQLERIDGRVYLIADPHEKRVVPEQVRDAERDNLERPHKYPTRKDRISMLPN